LRPGGLIDISETDRYLYDDNRQRFDLGTDELGPPWCARWLTFLRAATVDIGASIDAATHLHRWVSENPNFEDIVYKDYWLPMVPPIREDAPQSEGSRKFYRMMKMIVTVRIIYLKERKKGGLLSSPRLTFSPQGFIRSGRPMLLGSGLSEEFVNRLEVNVLQELAEARIPQYTRLQRVYARKKSN